MSEDALEQDKDKDKDEDECGRWTKHCLGNLSLGSCLIGARVWRQYLVEVRLTIEIKNQKSKSK